MECSEEVMNTSTNVMISGGSSGAAAAAAGGMDWYVWLSRAGLDRATAYEYALVFAHNELDEDDIPHLDHAFLLSMGVSVGKHRLQILHLAQRDIINDHRRSRRPGAPRPVVRLLSAAGRARSCLARCLRSLASAAGGPRGGRASTPAAALAAAQRDLYLGGSAGGQYYWRSAVLKREKKLALLKQGRLTLTDGGIRVVTAAAPPAPVSPVPSTSRSRSLSPLVMYGAGLRRGEGEEVGGDVDKYFWSGVAGEGEQEMRWDSMFGNLRPT